MAAYPLLTMPSARVKTVSMAASPTLADQAYAELKQLIFDFALMPGDRCSESR